MHFRLAFVVAMLSLIAILTMFTLATFHSLYMRSFSWLLNRTFWRHAFHSCTLRIMALNYRCLSVPSHTTHKHNSPNHPHPHQPTSPSPAKRKASSSSHFHPEDPTTESPPASPPPQPSAPTFLHCDTSPAPADNALRHHSARHQGS